MSKIKCKLEGLEPVVDSKSDQIDEKTSKTEFKDFILAGHDIGGYIAGAYALKPGRTKIKKLLFLSSLGLRPPRFEELGLTQEELYERYEHIRQQ